MGRKKQENRTSFHVRVDKSTPRKLNQLALLMGYKYGDGGAVGEFLDAIAHLDIKLVPLSSDKVVNTYKNKG